MCVDFGTCFALDTLPALHELLDEHLQLLDADIRHDDDVCDVALARELPLPDECLLLGPLEHDRRAELIEHRLDAGSLEHFHEAVRVRQAELDILLNARVPLQSVFPKTRDRVSGYLFAGRDGGGSGGGGVCGGGGGWGPRTPTAMDIKHDIRTFIVRVYHR